MSNLEALIDIISMAQQARPNDIGQSEDFRAQFTAWSSFVKMSPSKPGDSLVGAISGATCVLSHAHTGCSTLEFSVNAKGASMRTRARNLFHLAALLAWCGLCLSPGHAQGAGEPATKGGFVTTSDGVKIHYLEAGPQAPATMLPALLFVPGWTMPAEIWEKQIAHFSKTRRVVAMDPRSQGLSSQTTEGHYPEARARDIKAVVDGLKLAPAVLVGWSMGVAELVAYVDQFGCDSVAGLVLVDGTPGGIADGEMVRAFLGFFANFQRNREKAAAAFVRSMYRTPQSEAYFERIIQASLRTPTNTAMALVLGLVAVDRRPALAKITKPTLIIGAESPYSGLYDEMQKKIAGSRLEIFKNVGHALFVDDAERFNQTLEEFLKTL